MFNRCDYVNQIKLDDPLKSSNFVDVTWNNRDGSDSHPFYKCFTQFDHTTNIN